MLSNCTALIETISQQETNKRLQLTLTKKSRLINKNQKADSKGQD